MLLSLCAIINPLTGIVSAFGPDGALNTDSSSVPFWNNVANLTLFIWGTVGAFTGYMACVHDWSHKYLNIFMMFAIQTAWIGYIVGMYATGMGATMSAEENMFIPQAYVPNTTDVKFIGAMGVLGIYTYGFAFAGSSAFMVWCIHAYTIGKPETRSGDYFTGRMKTYSGVLAVAGLIQFLLGVWCQARFNMNVLVDGPITVAFWTVTYPGINMFVGLLQMINGVWGVTRAAGVGFMQAKPNYYQLSLAFQWICVLCLQDIMTLAYVGATVAGAAPTFAAFSLPLTLMPAFLDHKRTTLPTTFPDDYYGESESSVPMGSSEQPLAEANGKDSNNSDDDIETTTVKVESH
jgi:hypothetical protein